MTVAIVVGLMSGALAACGTSQPSTVPSSFATGASMTPPSPRPSASLEAVSSAPSAAAGFAFDPESIVGYYQSIGYAEAQTIVFAKWLDGREPTP